MRKAQNILIFPAIPSRRRFMFLRCVISSKIATTHEKTISVMLLLVCGEMAMKTGKVNPAMIELSET